jgi:nephrocystin-3
MAEHLPAAPDSREIRVFLSSTFRDFNEERRLLATQVFPELNREARKRGVELVEVDLRWGVTQAQAEDGHALEICLQEIERCQRYFIGMLGDSYGSLTPPERQLLVAAPSLLEQRQWLAGKIGQSSYTELEIEQRLQQMGGGVSDGRAFFYFRDASYSNPKADAGEFGWRSDDPGDRHKLEILKERIRSSGYPLVEALEGPQAITDRIKADLWALIDQQFPEGEQPDALEKEARKHADYRRSRTGAGQYIGGEAYIQQLERWLDEGQQQILITGESGAGKSALIANWMEAHQQRQPEDVVYAHHLGCTNDANALRPLLGRLIDTASAQLLEAEVITEPLAVPEEWWELVAKVAETLQSLGRWCEQHGNHWIWVLDGLDRLNPDDQTALPWLPQNLPAGVQVVASALACPARSILSERNYTTLTIDPLGRQEQEQLIQRYLERYTKELDGGLRQQILSHPLAGSPLFLKVLLEELRQCGRHDTLKEQLDFYLCSQTIDDLYERVLERLENDGSGEAVRKVMTAIWASRAGLAETELLEITDLAPLQWAPIDLALENAFGRNGNRLVFDHDFLRIAVKDRYLPSEAQQRQAHSELADWYQDREGWDERDSEELPWQLQEAGRLDDLRDWLLVPGILANLQWDRGSRETINYWLAVNGLGDGELDELIADNLEEEIEKRRVDAEDLIWFVDRIAALFDEAGLYREPLLKLRALSLELEEASEEGSEESILISLLWLANANRDLGYYDAALPLYQRCLEARERLLGPEHPETLFTVGNLAGLCRRKGDYEQAEIYYKRALEAREQLLGPEHPDTLTTVSDFGLLYFDKGDYGQAEAYYKRALEAKERLLGPEHPSTLTTVGNLGLLYSCKGDYEQAETFYKRDLEASERLLGPEHPDTLTTVGNLAGLFQDKGDYEQAEAYYKRDLEASERLLGPEHPNTLTTVGNLGLLYSNKGDYGQAEAYYKRALEAKERLLGAEHPSTLTTVGNLGALFQEKEDFGQAEAYYTRCLEARERLLGPEHPETLTIVGNLGQLYSDKGDYEQAEIYYKRVLEAREQLLGPEHPDTNATRYSLANLLSDQERHEVAIPLRRLELEVAAKRDGRDAAGTLTSIHRLAEDLYWSDELHESEELYREALSGRITALGDDDAATMASRYGLARCLSKQERYGEAIELRRVELAWCQDANEVDIKGMLISMHGLGCDLLAAGETEEALKVLQSCLSQRQRELGTGDDDTLGTLARVLEAYSSMGRQREALALSQEAQSALAAELGESHPKVLTQLSNQASLHDELGELEQAESLYRRCLQGREQALGADHADTLSTVYNLADVLSQQERHAEAIPLRRRELAWCREQNGDTDTGTLTSINHLAIDLRETGALEEAEALFRELVAGRQLVLEPGDLQIGQALGGLAKTLELAGKLEEALDYSKQVLDHRLAYEGPDAWLTNQARRDLARVLHKLGRNSEAAALLQELQASMAWINEPDDDDRKLISEAEELLMAVQGGKPE